MRKQIHCKSYQLFINLLFKYYFLTSLVMGNLTLVQESISFRYKNIVQYLSIYQNMAYGCCKTNLYK